MLMKLSFLTVPQIVDREISPILISRARFESSLKYLTLICICAYTITMVLMRLISNLPVGYQEVKFVFDQIRKNRGRPTYLLEGVGYPNYLNEET